MRSLKNPNNQHNIYKNHLLLCYLICDSPPEAKKSINLNHPISHGLNYQNLYSENLISWASPIAIINWVLANWCFKHSKSCQSMISLNINDNVAIKRNNNIFPSYFCINNPFSLDTSYRLFSRCRNVMNCAFSPRPVVCYVRLFHPSFCSW